MFSSIQQPISPNISHPSSLCLGVSCTVASWASLGYFKSVLSYIEEMSELIQPSVRTLFHCIAATQTSTEADEHFR